MNYTSLDALASGADLPELDDTLDLRIDRVVPVSPSQVWRAWTEPELLAQWFTPAPWSTASARIDARPGGAFDTVMAGPEGERMESRGCVLQAVPERLLVFTDGLTEGFRPSGGGFMTCILHLIPEGEGTRYVATVRHASTDARIQHEEMGFASGWGAALDQLVALMSATHSRPL